MSTFSVSDLRVISDAAVDQWREAADLDWDVPAGSLEWSCRTTAGHVVDTVFANLLAAIVESSPPATEAIIRRFPAVVTARPVDFAPRGALELAVHAHDIAQGLGSADAPRDE